MSLSLVKWQYVYIQVPDHVHRNLFRIHWWRGPSLRGLVKIMFYFPYFSCVLAAQWVEGWIFGVKNANKGIFSPRAKTSDDHTLLVHTFILSYFQYLKNITHCSTTRSIYILSHIISNQYLSWYITNHCDFLWGGGRTNDMLSLTDAYYQYPGYYTIIPPPSHA